MKVVIVDDIYEFSNIIKKSIIQVLIEENLDVGILTFDKYTKELNRLIYSNEIKIYILDYDLGENTSKNGYDIAREIRSDAHDWYSIIIICSIHNKKESFISARLSIFTYISKYHSFESNLKDTIKEAIEVINLTSTTSINTHCQLFHNEVLYASKEKYSKYCIIKTFDNEFRVRKNIYELQEELHLKKFKRHLLANEKNIMSVDEEEITFTNEEKIKL